LQRLYRRTVRAMPPKTRRVFVMHRIHRRPYKEIAAELGISIATVEYHMMRALRFCREAIAAEVTP
jgi:RNA polymerase sigma-70 factor (ECF subfamily)